MRLEWRKFASLRSNWVIVAVVLVAGAATSALFAWVAASVDRAAGPAVSPAECFSMAVTKASWAPLTAGVLAMASWAADRRHGTLTVLTLLTPRREVSVTARLVHALGIGAVLCLTSLALGAAVTTLAGPGQCLVISGPQLLGAAAAMGACTVGWVCLGLALGAVVRSQTLGLLVLLAGPFVAGRALALVASSADWLDVVVRFNPFRAAQQLQVPLSVPDPVLVGADAGPSATVAAVVFVGFSLICLVLATHHFARADVRID